MMRVGEFVASIALSMQFPTYAVVHVIEHRWSMRLYIDS